MRNRFSFFRISLFTLLFIGSTSWALPAPVAEVARKISLKEAIALAQAQNLDVAQAARGFELAQINYDNAWRTFFLPAVTLTSTSASAYTLGAIPGTPAADNWHQNQNHGYPSSALKLSVAQYTLFNFWRDRIAFDGSKLTFERSQQLYQEAKRNNKIQIINAYFQSKFNQESLEAANRSYQIAQTVLQLVKSRVPLKLATQNEVDSATVDMNDALVQMEAANTQYQTGLYNLNVLLNLPVTSLLDLTTPLETKPISLNVNQALSQYRLTSPTIRSSKLALQLAQNSVELAEKNRLPLPTVSFTGLNISYGSTYSGGYTNEQSTSSVPGGQIELQAAINLTLPIFGPGGLFGKDTVRTAYIQAELADLQLQSANLNGESQVRSFFVQIKQVQDQLKTIQQSFESSAQLLDRVVSQLSSKPANRLELRDALSSARASELSFLQITFSYISVKNSLFQLIGIDPEDGT